MDIPSMFGSNLPSVFIEDKNVKILQTIDTNGHKMMTITHMIRRVR